MKNKLLTALKYLSIGLLVILLLFFISVCLPVSPIGFPEDSLTSEELLIENITIVDVRNDTLLANRQVRIFEGTIVDISETPISSDAQRVKTIDGSGKFLLPAFWDMHVHLHKRHASAAAAEYVTNGVMHVRDMRGAYNPRDPFASTPERIRSWNTQIKARELLGPQVHNLTSMAVEGPHNMYDGLPHYFNCSDAEEARLLVDHFATKGVDLIKTYNNIPRDAFFELTRQAREAGIDVAGHKPVRISTIEAANAGMKSLEHARFLIWDSYPGAENLRNHPDPKAGDNTARRTEMLLQHDTLLLDRNLSAMRNNATWYCPTHMTRKADAYAEDETFLTRYDRINPILRFLAFEDLQATYAEDTTRNGRLVYKDFYRKALEITNRAHDKGVGILAGSDVPELPGSSLHEELEELARAGLSNYNVLKSATLSPARYYGKEKRYGTVEPGRSADLIILSRNPIDDIRATRAIDGLIFQGHYLDRTAIERIQKTVHTRNNSVITSAKLIWDIILYSTL